MKNKSFQLSIGAFLGLIFLFFFIFLLAISAQEMGNIYDVKKIAKETQEKGLPEFVENQITLANIESLRRIAEVAYVTNDARTRRNARLNAVALTTESIFERDVSFRSSARRISASITELAKAKDTLSIKEKKMESINLRLHESLTFFIEHATSQQIRRELLSLYNLRMDTTAAFYAEGKGFELTQAHSTLFTDQAFEIIAAAAKEIVAKNPENAAEITKHRQRLYDGINEIHDEYQSITALNRSTKQLWTQIDDDLKAIRDSITTGSERSISAALQTIQDATLKTQHSGAIMFAVLLVFFVVFCYLAHQYISKPLRWTSQKLAEIQSGELDDNFPVIHIREIANIADMLDRFSVHIAELYIQANLLAEDAEHKRNSEEVMKAVFKVSLDGYIVWKEGSVFSVSPGILQLLKIPTEEAFHEFWDEHFFSSSVDKISSHVKTFSVLREDILLHTAVDEPLPCEATHVGVLFNKQACILTYIRDLRQQKRNEEALLQAKEDAEVATKAKSEFLARMSHELRTPMNGVLGLTHLALKSSPPPKQQEFLAKIQASARLLLGIINDILDFSKIEEKKLELEHTDFTIAEILPTIASLLEAQAKEKGITFSINIQPETARTTLILGDPLRLSQVLLNLCGNAIKFTERGFVVLTVSVSEEDATSVRLSFAVKDSGIGMTPEQLERLFQAFSQADSSTTRKHGGTGLGLMISKLLVELMGGQIQVDSAPDQGSDFWFTLTFPKPTEDIRALNVANSADEITLDLGGASVLVAEDNLINQEIIESLLEEFGCSVVIADNGQEALDLFTKQKFTCVLLDIQMPVMDGLTAAMRMRQVEAEQGIEPTPIIAMTAHAMQEDVDKSHDAGMNAHLTKPIDVSALQQCLKIQLKL